MSNKRNEWENVNVCKIFIQHFFINNKKKKNVDPKVEMSTFVIFLLAIFSSMTKKVKNVEQINIFAFNIIFINS